MSGLTGSVPYGVDGSVPALPTADGEATALAALAIGASAIAPPIAAAANHGVTWVIFVFMIPSIGARRAGVVTADTRLTLQVAGNSSISQPS
jgi:hypothetical protein